MRNGQSCADVCLVLEGTYPYVSGGVSTWTHDLLKAQEDLSFHLVTILPLHADLSMQYELPPNVTGMTEIQVQGVPTGCRISKEYRKVFESLEEPLSRLLQSGSLAELAEINRVIDTYRGKLGGKILLDSIPAWNMLLRMYHKQHQDSSFLDYFWTWRALLGGLYSLLLRELPPARIYHAISTGYAGIFAARGAMEAGRPVLLTEHGIYTNERRIEISMADWLYELPIKNLSVGQSRQNLKDMWINTFVSYSRACYEACSKIITLYEGNQAFQMEDGAPAPKLEVIPNGIDFPRYSSIKRVGGDHPPRVALIGRVVPIKDVKTFIRGIAHLRSMIPDLEAWILGPTDEDEEYFHDCKTLVSHLSLDRTVQFKGRVKLDDYLGRIDVIALTSISEAQPLVILEAGAAAIPSVTTDVGACREMILGRSCESPALGDGGVVTELSNPTATANGLARLLMDREFYQSCSHAIQERARRYYNKKDLDRTYRDLYERYRQLDSVHQNEVDPKWPELASNYAS
jgi:glycosyltransferase involved in cell wall biosynthesis